jgi:hypothetical protein
MTDLSKNLLYITIKDSANAIRNQYNKLTQRLDCQESIIDLYLVLKDKNLEKTINLFNQKTSNIMNQYFASHQQLKHHLNMYKKLMTNEKKQNVTDIKVILKTSLNYLLDRYKKTVQDYCKVSQNNPIALLSKELYPKEHKKKPYLPSMAPKANISTPDHHHEKRSKHHKKVRHHKKEHI